MKYLTDEEYILLKLQGNGKGKLIDIIKEYRISNDFFIKHKSEIINEIRFAQYKGNEFTQLVIDHDDEDLCREIFAQKVLFCSFSKDIFKSKYFLKYYDWALYEMLGKNNPLSKEEIEKYITYMDGNFCTYTNTDEELLLRHIDLIDWDCLSLYPDKISYNFIKKYHKKLKLNELKHFNKDKHKSMLIRYYMKRRW